LISNARLGLRLPISGHSLLVSYFICRRVLHRQTTGFCLAELVFASAILAILAYVKILWWNDPITLFAGVAIGAILAISGKLLVNQPT
jgi:hypothetical protein